MLIAEENRHNCLRFDLKAELESVDGWGGREFQTYGPA